MQFEKMLKFIIIVLISCLILLSVVTTQDSPIKVSIKADKLSLKDSVSITVRAEICVPQVYKFLRARILSGQVFRFMHDRLNILKRTLGKFASYDKETIRVAGYRQCTRPGTQVTPCPTNTVQLLTGDAALARLDTVQLADHLDTDLGHSLTLWNMFGEDYQSPDLAYTSNQLSTLAPWKLGAQQDSRDITSSHHEGNVFYLKIDNKVIEGLDFLSDVTLDSAGNITLNQSSPKDIEQTFRFIHSKLTETQQFMIRLTETTIAMRKGIFPSQLFPFKYWLETYFGIIGRSDEEQKEKMRFIINVLMTEPLTTVRVTKECDPLTSMRTVSRDCALEMITLMPQYSSIQRMQKLQLISHPVTVDTDEKIWKRVIVPSGTFLRSNNKYYSYDNKLECFPSKPTLPCQWCTSGVALPASTDRCLELIASGKIETPTCKLEDVPDDQIRSIQVIPKDDGKDVIITSKDPVAVIQNCENTGDQSTSIPLSATVHLSHNCSDIKIVNAPTVNEMSPLLEITSVPIKKKVIETIKEKVKTGMNEIQDHMEDHGYIYVLSTSGAMVVLFLILTLRCGIRRTCRHCIRSHVYSIQDGMDRNKRVHSRTPETSAGQDSEVRMMMLVPSAQPVRPLSITDLNQLRPN